MLDNRFTTLVPPNAHRADDPVKEPNHPEGRNRVPGDKFNQVFVPSGFEGPLRAAYPTTQGPYNQQLPPLLNPGAIL
jgi:hypothetical protein